MSQTCHVRANEGAEATKTVGLDPRIAVASAELSLKTGLGTVDSVTYASATRHGAELVTSDPHFQGLARVSII